MIHDTNTCDCEMCIFADKVEKRLAEEKAAEEERLEVMNVS